MLSETGVAATPGLDFDPAHGSHLLRRQHRRHGGGDEAVEGLAQQGKAVGKGRAMIEGAHDTILRLLVSCISP